MHLDDISGEKYALYVHNLLLENVDDLPFISFYNDFSLFRKSLECNACYGGCYGRSYRATTALMGDVGIRPIVIMLRSRQLVTRVFTTSYSRLTTC